MFQEYLKRHGLRVIVSLGILSFFLVHASKVHEWDLINRFESIAYDLRLRLTMPETANEQIVIVAIDEKSLAAEGRWPWPRDRIARLVDQLVDHYGVTLVAFDVVFAEPEEISALELLDEIESDQAADNLVPAARYEQLRSRYDHDETLARSLDGRKVILGVFFTSEDESVASPDAGQLPVPLFRRGSFTGRDIPFASGSGYAANLAELQSEALGTGHLMSLTDADGLVRRVPMLYEFNGDYYESLSMAVTRSVLGVKDVELGFPDGSRSENYYSEVEWLRIGELTVPVDARVTALVPFRGRQGSFPYISATDVINGTAPLGVLDDRIVLFGATAADRALAIGPGENPDGVSPRFGLRRF